MIKKAVYNLILISGILFVLLKIAACKNNRDDENHKPQQQPAQKLRILVQPLGKTDTQSVNRLQSDIESSTGLPVSVLPPKSLPAFAFYKPRNRYTADSLLVYLKTFSSSMAVKVIGITDKDISTSLRGSPSWGVMGLAHCPGQSCVISSFRAKRGISRPDHLRQRMLTLALHESGHTMGLPHCEKECLMKDAGGKMNLDEASTYCPDCHSFLTAKGFLQAGR